MSNSLKLALTAGAVSAATAANPAYVCSLCVIGLGLVEQAAFQVHLERNLQEKCDGNKLCEYAVQDLVFSIEGKAKPEDICNEIQACTSECNAYDEWPVNPLPPKPPAWPTERRSLSSEAEKQIKAITAPEHERDLTILKPVFESFIDELPKSYDSNPWTHITFGLKNMVGEFLDQKNDAISASDEEQLSSFPDSCSRHNISCKIEALVDHKPLQDHDGDRFSTKQMRRLRGSDWRGYDCDDQRDDVYPGRLTYASSTDAANRNLDHNCNGIYGGNATGMYEDIFCGEYQPRGLVILGDSATAHFHIPPQWITADGWNMDQLLPDAMNEVDMPHCSWGTGHASPEDCPYQAEVPGVEGVTSLYTQMRERNRCNHNDFQNIGVNGARMTSSDQLVEALARDPLNDNPLTVWLALIGNDVCNGHPGFDHMTEPEDFYEHAMATLNKLDTIVPPKSHVVSLALFDGELLYATMHKELHPIGTSYASVYDFMNCLEENPCWGWLNSNATVRRETTVWSDKLNMVYQVCCIL